MDMMELVKTRRSVRTFDGRPLRKEDESKLRDYIQAIENPYGIPVRFLLLDAEEHGLSSPVIVGERCYVTAKVDKVPHSEEAYGYSFEKLVLYAWSLGIGTTWIGGTMKRSQFERAADVQDREWMFCVSPLGYPAEKMSVREGFMRKTVKADERKSAEQLFFDRDFSTPLVPEDEKLRDALEMVRWAPSATNSQPWRIVRAGGAFHFYLAHTKGYTDKAGWDMQKIDMGIALCHFMDAMGGALSLSDPGIPAGEGTEYIATVAL